MAGGLTRGRARLGAFLRRQREPRGYARVIRRIERLEANTSQVAAALHPELGEPESPRARLRLRELKVRSQNGEDGILLYLFSQIGAKYRRFVEFGVGDGREWASSAPICAARTSCELACG